MSFRATAVVDFRVANSRGIKDRRKGCENLLHVTFDDSYQKATAKWAGGNNEEWILLASGVCDLLYLILVLFFLKTLCRTNQLTQWKRIVQLDWQLHLMNHTHATVATQLNVFALQKVSVRVVHVNEINIVYNQYVYILNYFCVYLLMLY